MKHFRLLALVAAVSAVIATTPAFAAAVGVSVNLGQPGFHGRIDIGDYPRPRVIYRRPMVIEQVPISSGGPGRATKRPVPAAPTESQQQQPPRWFGARLQFLVQG